MKPDVLVAAPSVEAFRQGDYQVVLGEVHVAINTLDRWIFFCQHPNPEELRAAIISDLPDPSVIPTFPKGWNLEEVTKLLGLPLPAVNGRMDVALHADKDYYLDAIRAAKQNDALVAYVKRLQGKMASDVVYKKEVVDEPKVKANEESQPESDDLPGE